MSVSLTVPKLACGACVETVTQTIQSLDLTAQVEADLPTKTVVIRSTVAEAVIREALSQAGYPAL